MVAKKRRAKESEYKETNERVCMCVSVSVCVCVCVIIIYEMNEMGGGKLKAIAHFR